jgi:hypothetical protein
MLTGDEQRMSPTMRRLYRTIVRERDFACFQEKVSAEEVVKSHCSALGLNVCEALREWTGVPGAGTRKRIPSPALSRDDDDDSPSVLPRDYDDDNDGDVCPLCNGDGKDGSGGDCALCDGTGKISPAPSDDDDEEDVNDE